MYESIISWLTHWQLWLNDRIQAWYLQHNLGQTTISYLIATVSVSVAIEKDRRNTTLWDVINCLSLTWQSIWMPQCPIPGIYLCLSLWGINSSQASNKAGVLSAMPQTAGSYLTISSFCFCLQCLWRQLSTTRSSLWKLETTSYWLVEV